MEQWNLRSAFHVEYGLSRHVGRFAASVVGLHAGQSVILRTRRGMEIGRIIAEARDADPLPQPFAILRAADDEDRARVLRAETQRHRHFAECRRFFDEGIWPIEPIDVEPLLDEGRAILHYLGPHKLDVSGLIAALHSASGLEFVFEPAGPDVDEPVDGSPPSVDDHGCGGGGCATGGCSSSASAGTGSCSGCSVGALVSSRRRSSSHS